MPECAIVSITDDWEMMNTATGGIIRTSATAAPAPARAMPAEAICWRTVVSVYMDSL